MVQKNFLFYLIYVSAGVFSVFAQEQKESVVVLKEVILTDAKLVRFSNGIKISKIPDSVAQLSNSSLTDLLRYNSNIYFKENGYGMVSSASFRGTSAQQTAVVWNGININSQLTGQTDFNTLIPENFGDISVRSGGGSVQYGSGAIGGSIHLNDELNFKQKIKNRLLLSVGSFNSQKVSFNSNAGGEKWSYDVGVNYMESDNDYKYLGTDQINENGAFKNVNVNTNFGYFISKNQLLKFYHNTFIGNRNFSSTLTAPSNSNYEDVNSRSLLEWNHFNSISSGKLKLAYLTEEYKYFANKDTERFTFGQSKNILANYDYKQYLGAITLNGIIEYSNIKGKGTSLENIERNLFSTTLLMSHKLNDDFKYGLSLRKEFVTDYDSPFIVAVDAKYKISSKYSSTINFSKNYRVPTFNDLYWVGAGARGNKELKPELSKQVDWGHILKFENVSFKLNGFYIVVNDLIQWRPIEAVWTPVNITETEHYGAELEFNIKKLFGAHTINWITGASYTIAINKVTDKQLLYVPKEKISSNLNYDYHKWGVFYQFLYNAKAFTTTDNTDFVSSYTVSNIGIQKEINVNKKVALQMVLKVNNLYNTSYQNVSYRPMPNRNYQLQLITKF
ncbi:TonB-dependent receptor [Cellulophaga sp. L1A9]|uniref:TonB-dependent receptor n=1 Tax=Cellulophaga sp. L1A9 TaxID=2686362 RepID=UPI00131E8C30|nr:TonB-dependent receptor [Cellulophaga sp. L1A9]